MPLTDTATPRAAQQRMASRLRVGGVNGAVVGFSVSLLPSLLPREPLLQGVLSGLLVAAGYGLGALVARGARPLGAARVLAQGLLLALLLLASAIAWHWLGWQNAQRLAMGMPPLEPLAWFTVLVVAGATAAVLLVSARGLRRLARRADTPAAGALLLTAAVVAILAVLFGALVAATTAFAGQRDAGTTAGTTQPESSLRSGSPASLVSWDSLGRKGRDFVAFGPTVAELSAANGAQALEPIRVYVGTGSADSVPERAQLAVAELERTGAFDREVLVLAVPTGTGLVEPFAADALEYLHNGDTAIAAVSYSNLPSWLSIAMDRQKVRDTAEALFAEVYAVWRTLPADRRPELYLYGHSLGAYGWQPVLAEAADLPEPITGALLAGPPFRGAIAAPTLPGARFLQHPTDPVVLVSPSLAWRPPAWLGRDRLPDLPPQMRWLPGVTWLQVAADLPQAVFVPWGHGHMYSERDYLQGWGGDGVGQQRIEQLVELMRNDSSPVSYMLS